MAISTPNWPKTTEEFNFIADSDEDVFTTETTVYTRKGGVAVSATTIVGLTSRTASGSDGQPLIVTINR